MKYDVVIIGTGLAGLLCGYVLSKEGFNVCVLDRNDRVGGMMQSFVRNGVVFNTGLNYTESLGKGEVLHRYFNFYGLTDKLTLKQLDRDKADLITIGDKEYALPQGHQQYVEAMSAYFPTEAASIASYMKGLEEVCNSFPLYRLDDNFSDLSVESPYISQSASGFIESFTSNKDLKAVLAGTNILYAGQKDVTALYTHALINYSFNKSAWRIKEGGSGIANILMNGIKNNGGVIRRCAEVEELEVSQGDISSIVLSGGERMVAKYVISSVHPKTLLSLIDEQAFKKAYRNRITSQEDSIGMFSLYIVLKENKIKYQNYNHHIFKSNQIWTTESKDWPQNCLMYTQYNHQTTGYANGLTIIAYMKYAEVEQWANSTVENRGEEYERFKREKAEQLITLAERKMPGLRAHIKSYYTSTPLTYRDYTGSFQGSAYGTVKAYNNPLFSILSPQTRVKNLLLTGQNLNMHGILGVSISSFLSCACLLGEEYLYKKLINS